MDLEITMPTQYEMDLACTKAVESLLKDPHSFLGAKGNRQIKSSHFSGLRSEAILRESKISGARLGAKARYLALSEILNSTSTRKTLDTVFNFGGLSPDAKIVLPVISEVNGSVDLSGDRLSANTSRRSWRIIKPARITTGLLTWRQYLKFQNLDNSAQQPINSFFAPQSKKETKAWRAGFCAGYSIGYKQANQLFVLQLNQLKRDYLGMWRFRQLEMQGIVTYPEIIETRLGTMVNDNVVFIDKRDVRITAATRFTPTENWRTR